MHSPVNDNMFRTTYDVIKERQKQNRKIFLRKKRAVYNEENSRKKQRLKNWIFKVTFATQEEGYRRRLVVDKRKDPLKRSETLIDASRP